MSDTEGAHAAAGRRHRLLRAHAWAALLAILATAIGCSSGSHDGAVSGARRRRTGVPTAARVSVPSRGCSSRRPVGAGATDETLVSGGQRRAYQRDVPPGYDGTSPYALVFFLHSLSVDYRIVPGMSGIADMNPKYPFIGVAPSGLRNANVPYWNAAAVEDNYDVVYLTDLLDHLEATLCIDTARVFSVGMSNGAQMSSLLACRLPDRIAAIAPIAGAEFNEPCPGAPVPIIAFHGVEDPVVPYAGGGLNSVTIADQNFYKGALPADVAKPTGIDESMRRWARHNGCDPGGVETRISPEVRKRTWRHCRAATVVYLVDNGGHTWPGKPQPALEKTFGHGTTDIDATSLAFAFFFDRRTS